VNGKNDGAQGVAPENSGDNGAEPKNTSALTALDRKKRL